MRGDPSVLHVDLDAFFAAVEQRDKPSLRGKPVVVGGIGLRGVVSTASYEARKYGVRSAMSTAEARSRCPHAAYLGPRFEVYRQTSQAVMAEMRALSPLVEPLSLDEAFIDLAASGLTGLTVDDVQAIANDLKAAIRKVSGGLTASVGAGTSKLIAKIASDLDKPDGVVVVPAGTEAEFLAPMQVTVIPGCRSGDRPAAEHGRRADRRRPAAARRGRADPAGRIGARLEPVPAGDRGRRPPGGERPGDQVGQRRGHLRDRHHRPRRCWPRSATGWPTASPNGCRRRSCPAGP